MSDSTSNVSKGSGGQKFSLNRTLLASATHYLYEAESSDLKRRLANLLFSILLPWNAKRGIFIDSIEKGKGVTYLRYQRSNLNHLGGLHACALATVGEFACGVTLLRSIDSSRYRLIMKRLETDYKYQGLSDVTATCTIDLDYLENTLIPELEGPGEVTLWLASEVTDTEGRLVCKVQTQWQLKSWSKISSR